MNNFLKNCRKLISNNASVILGNESCDLDSAISTISLAFHFVSFPVKRLSDDIILPVINVTRSDLPLKTEVVYFLNENNIDLKNLICSDEIDLEKAKQFVLVDHHVSKYREKVVMVVDHRPFDITSSLESSCQVIVEECGSCCTLIANYMKDCEYVDRDNYNEILRLLYGPIVLDTINFSKSANRARLLDFKIAEFIEDHFKIQNNLTHRKTLFDNLVTARSDISSLNSYQLLLKDHKIISNKSGDKIIALPGFPMLVEDFLKQEQLVENFNKFATQFNADIVVLIGLEIDDNIVKRDVGIINFKNNDLFESANEALINSNEFNFEQKTNLNFLNGKFYKQNNITLTRKQILPIVKKVLEES